MLFAPIFMVIFVISKLKYVGIRSFKAIENVLLSEVHPRLHTKGGNFFVRDD